MENCPAQLLTEKPVDCSEEQHGTAPPEDLHADRITRCEEPDMAFITYRVCELAKLSVRFGKDDRIRILPADRFRQFKECSSFRNRKCTFIDSDLHSIHPFVFFTGSALWHPLKPPHRADGYPSQGR